MAWARHRLKTCLAIAAAVAQVCATAQERPSPECGGPRSVVPSGQSGSDIQWAIRRGGEGSTIVLSGNYQVDAAIDMRDGVTLCSNQGATLTWSDPDTPGMMISALRADGITVKNLILDGRGIAIRGDDHRIEGNLIRNIAGGSTSKRRWGERHGVFIADHAKGAIVRGNVFKNIVDTGVMGYGLAQSLISENLFSGVAEGIHLWSSQSTLVRKNSGQAFKSMFIEIQGDSLPGLVVEDNSFKGWQPEHDNGAYAMSVVSGVSAIVRRNTIETNLGMNAGLEVGGIGPQVTDNTLTDADIVITDAPDTLIQGNKILRGSIVKDVNRPKRGTLVIRDNQITNPHRYGIHTDHWWGYEQVTITGNRISKQVSPDTQEFAGILMVDSNRQPPIVSQNEITIRPVPGATSIRSARVGCLANAGHQGNLRGTVVAGNSCDGGGVGVFATSNAPGGHAGVVYRDNRLQRLRDSISGDSSGLQSSGNRLDRVDNDAARLGER